MDWFLFKGSPRKAIPLTNFKYLLYALNINHLQYNKEPHHLPLGE